MPPVVGETVKPGGSNRRKIAGFAPLDGFGSSCARDFTAKTEFCLFVAGAVARGFKVWFTNRESERLGIDTFALIPETRFRYEGRSIRIERSKTWVSKSCESKSWKSKT
jgi:hypothetical protein